MSNRLRLAIAGASARAAAFSALRAGFDVVTADLFADEDLRRRCPATRIPASKYPEGLADWLAHQQVDAWMYTGALENFPQLVDRMAGQMLEKGVPLWGNQGETLRRCRDPFELARVCKEAGIHFPETRPTADGLPLDGSWLCKTYRGAGGSGTWLLDSQESRRRAFLESACFQRKLDGELAAGVFIALDRQQSRLEVATRQLIRGAHFDRSTHFDSHTHSDREGWAYSGSVVDVTLRERVSRGIDLKVPSLVRAFGLMGIFGIDMVIDNDEVWVIEINPRYPASAEIGERDRGRVAGHAIAFGCAREALSVSRGSILGGKVIVYCKRITSIEPEFHQWAMEQADAGRLADIPAAGTRLEKGQPVLTILEASPGEGMLDRLKSRATEVESRLYR